MRGRVGGRVQSAWSRVRAEKKNDRHPRDGRSQSPCPSEEGEPKPAPTTSSGPSSSVRGSQGHGDCWRVPNDRRCAGNPHSQEQWSRNFGSWPMRRTGLQSSDGRACNKPAFGAKCRPSLAPGGERRLHDPKLRIPCSTGQGRTGKCTCRAGPGAGGQPGW